MVTKIQVNLVNLSKLKSWYQFTAFYNKMSHVEPYNIATPLAPQMRNTWIVIRKLFKFHAD